MKFAVGYQLAEADEEPFVDVVGDYADRIAEVYFPWADLPSGRAALLTRRGHTDWSGQRRLERDLLAFREMGLKLAVLFNAACYGRHAVSEFLANRVISVLEHFDEVAGGADVVTTTSPAVARTVKRHFAAVEVRASVNMRIGTVRAMEYVADLFDSFCVRREHNRDLSHLSDLKAWADANAKGLTMLANSGCLAHCSGQTFHDNMVAHEAAIDETARIADFNPHVCANYFADRAHWPMILANTWVRPEDLHHYEGLFDVVKLATRQHARPRTVIHAYARSRHRGNLLDLLEPSHAHLFAPHIIDNERFGSDWFARSSRCDHRCRTCRYCADVLEQVLVQPGDPAGEDRDPSQ